MARIANPRQRANDLLKNRLDPLMIRFKYSDTEFYSEYERARTIVD